MAPLDGTWFADVSVPHRLLDPSNAAFGDQAEAILSEISGEPVDLVAEGLQLAAQQADAPPGR